MQAGIDDCVVTTGVTPVEAVLLQSMTAVAQSVDPIETESILDYTQVPSLLLPI